MLAKLTRSLSFAAFLMSISAVFTTGARAAEYDGTFFLQGLVGAAQFSEEDLTFRQAASSDATTAAENDLSTMPYFGVAVQWPLGGDTTEWGLEGNLLFGLHSSDKQVVATNNQVSVRVDSDLWLTDLAAGLYAAHLTSRWRFYVAAGPAMMFGEYSDDTIEEDLTVNPIQQVPSSHSESEFGIGGYARGGLEYRLDATQSVGVCVRWVQTNLQFDNAPGSDSELSGFQGFLSFSKYF